jgi:hypothetical protein
MTTANNNITNNANSIATNSNDINSLATEVNTLQQQTTNLSFSGYTSTFAGVLESTLFHTSQIEPSTGTSGEIKILGETQVNDIASTKNLAVGNDLLVAGMTNIANLKVLNNISCDAINARGSAQYDFKIVGYLRASGFIPICKTIPLASNFCSGAFNLNTILLGSGVTLSLLPTYKVVMYDSNGIIVFTANNTSGNDMGYYNVTAGINVNQIFIYNNNVLLL